MSKHASIDKYYHQHKRTNSVESENQYTSGNHSTSSTAAINPALEFRSIQ